MAAGHVMAADQIRSGKAMALVPLAAALLVLGGIAAFAVALFDYIAPASTVDHSVGALLVVCSSAIMSAAAIVVGVTSGPAWLRVVLEIGIALDILGTAVAAWFLETNLLLALMIVAAVAWILLVAGQVAERSRRAAATRRGDR